MKKLKSYWFVFTFIVISYNVLSQKTPNGNPADFKVKTGLHSIGYAGLWRGRVQLTVDEFLEKAKKLGVDALMIMAKRPHLSPMDYDKKVRSKLKKRIEDQGLTLIGLAGYLDFTAGIDKPGIPHTEIQSAYNGQVAELASDLGTDMLRIFTGYERPGISYDKQYSLVLEGIKMAAKEAQKNGVTLAIQNHHDKSWKLNSIDDTVHYSQVFSEDGAWCWFTDPRAIYNKGIHDRTYVGYVTSKGDITISFYDHQTEEIKEVVIYPGLQQDDHVNPSLLFLPDGRLMTFFTRHNGGFYYTRSKYPEDISQWEEVSYIDLGPRLCYTNPILLSSENDRIYVFMRGGHDWKPTFIYSDDLGESWSDPQTFVAHPGASDRNRPYAKIVSDGKSKIWFAITDGHPNVEPLNSIYIFYYEDSHFYQVDGTLIAHIKDSPIDQGIIRKAYDGSQTMVRSWIWDLALNDNRYPRMVYTRLKEKTCHQYYYAFWNGSSWEHSFISPAGHNFPPREVESHYSGGIVLDPEREGVVYYSRPVRDRFEVFRAELTDNKWDETPVTQQSELDNVRPFIARNSKVNNYPRLFWMSNRMYQHYSNFDTFLLMKLQQ